MEQALTLAAALIQIPSPNPPSEERPVAQSLAAWLQNAGIDAEVLGVGSPDAPQANVFARIPGQPASGDVARPALIFCGHLDTVPAGEGGWDRDPYRPVREGGRLYGLGATDMKGAVAAMCVAAARLAREGRLAGDLLLAFTSGEETGSRGARALAESGRLDGAGGVVIGEPTGNRVGIAEKGGIWLDVTLVGRTAHGSLPHLGANAVAALAEALFRLEEAAGRVRGGTTNGTTNGGDSTLSDGQRRLRAALGRRPHPLLEAPTLAVTRAAGGVATNVVPDRATAVLDIRTLPGQSGAAILSAVDAVVQEVAHRRGLRGEVTSRGERVALEIAADHPLALACALAVEQVTAHTAERCGLTGATDATELVPTLQVPFVICGPGQMAQAHQPNEWVEEAAVGAAVEIYARLARHMLSR